MSASGVATVGVLLFGWAVLSGTLARRNVTGPLIFAVAGYVLGNPDWGVLAINVSTSAIHVVAEVTLALLLFSDAARVNVHELRGDKGMPSRLLGIGLPLTVAFGVMLAALLFDLPWALALFLGAALAPTDAALSLQVIEDERIPMRIRRSLNVESGLNDGIVTPIVTVAIAMAASQLGDVHKSVAYEFGMAMRELGIGLIVGVVMGIGGALVLSRAARSGWIASGGRRIAALALAVSAFEVTLALDGNGFIAAFVAGAAFGASVDRAVVELDHVNELPELGGELLALVVWFLFGASLLPIAVEHLDWRIVLYALGSLTIVRMIPVALSMIGARIDGPTTMFLAWFGPRGLASVVFAILAIEELGGDAESTRLAVAVVATTVAASILLHGLSAGPGGRSYVQREADHSPHRPAPRRPTLRQRVGP